LLVIGGLLVGLALLFWVRTLVVAMVTIITLLLGVLLVLVAVFGPILGLIPEPAPVAQDVYEQTQHGMDHVKDKVDTVQQGLDALDQLHAASNSLQTDSDGDQSTSGT